MKTCPKPNGPEIDTQNNKYSDFPRFLLSLLVPHNFGWRLLRYGNTPEMDRFSGVIPLL
jgi:hypothetical protein